MSYLLILAAAGATYIGNPRTTLDAQEAIDLGIVASAHNFEYEIMDEPSPLFVNLELSGFTACQVSHVGIEVMDTSGNTVYGSSVAANRGSSYSFRLEREYLDSTTMAVVCHSGPDALDYVYLFELGNLVKAPDN